MFTFNRYKDNNPLLVGVNRCCQHKTNSSFNCLKFENTDLLRNRRIFYSNVGKTEQDCYITRLLTPCSPERTTRTQESARKRERQFSCNYYLFNKKKKLVKICMNLFLKVFSLGRGRLRHICKIVHEGRVVKENRGGNRKKQQFEARRESVKKFIEKLPAKESHYNRSKCKRIYLDANLSISKLHGFYNAAVENNYLKVEYSFFRSIFNNDFNIGFSSPTTDACSLCVLLKNQIKFEKDAAKRNNLMLQKRIHTLRANAFYTLIKESPEGSISFCFDLQQILPLPKTPIQECFYARQINFYNLCIVGINSKNPNFYCWTENQSGKGCIEIGSALLCYLNNLEISHNVTQLRLFSDGCSGQNKNSYVIFLLMYWLVKKSPKTLQDIQITFPVRGHSFLPADRVFGRVEKTIGVHPVITKKEEYIDLLSQHGKVNFLKDDWETYDIKGLESFFKKIDGIRDLKRIFIKKKIFKKEVRCVVKTMQYFKFENENEQYKCLLKKGRSYKNLKLEKKKIGRSIKKEKKKDVDDLLTKQFGVDWRSHVDLQWYLSILNDDLQEEDFEENLDEEECNCLEQDCGLKI